MVEMDWEEGGGLATNLTQHRELTLLWLSRSAAKVTECQQLLYLFGWRFCCCRSVFKVEPLL